MRDLSHNDIDNAELQTILSLEELVKGIKVKAQKQ